MSRGRQRTLHDGYRTGFAGLGKGGYDWNLLPMRLFVKGNARFWNAADIDFSADAEDWQRLSEELAPPQREVLIRLASLFLAGEEAVTEDIQPFMTAMAAEGRSEDEFYLTQFAFEEAKHAEGFRRWLDALGIHEDLHFAVEDIEGYRLIFYELLPEALQRLRTDPSPAAQVRASVIYNQVVEGTLALTGYHAWLRVSREQGIFPGMQRLIGHIADDERRHMAWGTYTCRRHVASDDANWNVIDYTMGELMQPALSVTTGMFDLLEEQGYEMPFGLTVEHFADYALDRFSRRMGAIESARAEEVATIDTGTVEEDMEEQFAREDAEAMRVG